jgi:hypothetical protein
MIGMAAGSFIGGYVPVLFGASAMGFASIICGAIGGLVGIYAGFKLSE